MSNQKVNRRTVLKSFCVATALGNLGAIKLPTSIDEEYAKLAKYVHPKVSWSYSELNDFLDLTPDDGLVSMQKSLQLIPFEQAGTPLPDRKQAIKQIQTQLLWVSSNIVTYPFGNEDKIGYHNLTKWVASEFNVDRWIIDTQPTLIIERAIQERLFVEIWDKLTLEQRKVLLEKMKDNEKAVERSGASALGNGATPPSNIEAEDVVAIASLSGAGALAALSLTAHLTGFAFYATMSTVISTTAAFFGITLPFAAFTSASTIVAFLTGPVGWALLAIAAAAGVALAGRANPRKTAAAICQIHSLKVAALQAANEMSGDVFSAMGDPLKRQLVGRWRITEGDRITDLGLASDGSFSAKCFRIPDGDPSNADLLWDGKGTWTIRDKAISVNRSHTWWGIYWASDPMTLIEAMEIEELSTTEAKLSGGVMLKRL